MTKNIKKINTIVDTKELIETEDINDTNPSYFNLSQNETFSSIKIKEKIKKKN